MGELTTVADHKIVNGTHYHGETPDDVIAVLERARKSRTRLHLSFGYNNTIPGLDNLSEFETYGYISRTMGPLKCPIIVHNSRGIGGGMISTQLIVRIQTSNHKLELWRHPQYHQPRVEIQEIEPVTFVNRSGGPSTWSFDVYIGDSLWEHFETLAKAKHYCKKIGAENVAITLLDKVVAQ